MLKIEHIGVIIGILILVILLITCHISNGTRANFQNVNPANRIIYYSASDKMSSNICPGAHPRIPCSLVKECPKSGPDRLTQEQRSLVDQYIYLASLLNTIDVYKFKNPGYWYL